MQLDSIWLMWVVVVVTNHNKKTKLWGHFSIGDRKGLFQQQVYFTNEYDYGDSTSIIFGKMHFLLILEFPMA